ncbi:unnamed protein product, partial [marine sediment metagenome]
AYLKTREYDFEVKFDFITKSNHLSVKSKFLFLLAIKDTATIEDFEKVIKTSKRWFFSVLETLIRNEVVGYDSKKDFYFLRV